MRSGAGATDGEFNPSPRDRNGRRAKVALGACCLGALLWAALECTVKSRPAMPSIEREVRKTRCNVGTSSRYQYV